MAGRAVAWEGQVGMAVGEAAGKEAEVMVTRAMGAAEKAVARWAEVAMAAG